LLAQRLVVLAIVAAVGGAVLGFVFAGSPGTIAAGVKIDGVDVGGLTAGEARLKLERRAAAVAEAPVTFTAAGHKWRLKPVSLGVEADWGAAEYMLALRNITPQTTPMEEFLRLRGQMAHGNSGVPIVGDPDHIAAQLIELSGAGLTGIAVSLVNYADELPYFRDEVLPRLERAGLRVSSKAA